MADEPSGKPRHTVADPEPRWTLDPQVKHLNHGSFGAVPEAVQAEQRRLQRLMEWNPVRWFASVTERIRYAREDIATILRTEPSSLAFVPNASAGASVVYAAFLGRGPVDVMVTDHGYGAVTMGAERLTRRTGGSLTTSQIPLEATAEDAIQILTRDMDRHRPTLLVIDQITSATARAFPVDEICRLARERAILTLVDGAHAPGVLADPVAREADFWIGNLHKFACAPRGTGVLVSPRQAHELYPLIDSWGARLPFPERFDHVGTMDVTPWLTAPFAWRHLDKTIGWAQIRRRSSELAEAGSAIVASALAEHMVEPIPLVGQPAGPMRLVKLPGDLGSTREEADALRVPFSDASGIAVSFTSFAGQGFLRLSAHVYNSIHDYQYLASVGVPLLHRWSQEKGREAS